MTEYNVELTVGAPYQFWCDRHQDYHYGAALYTIGDEGPKQVATICPAHTKKADGPTEKAVGDIWNDAAIAKAELIGGEWVWWDDLDEHAKSAARTRIEAFLGQLMDDIPAEEDADD